MLPVITVTRRFSFSGDSMLPLLQDGDQIWVRSIPWEQAASGDLMVFARFSSGRPSLVVHRLLAKDRTAVRTRGDACRQPDAPAQPGDFLGKVVGFERGALRLALESAPGRRWNWFCRIYGRLFLGWWREAAGPLGGPGRGLLRAALLPARLAAGLFL